ncbi:hypothetical protein vseg_020757 [Gypsophila vaccaria]
MARSKSSGSSSAAILAIVFVLMGVVGQCYGQEFGPGYYRGKCRTYDVENEIYKVVSAAYYSDKTIVAALLRMLFHDSYGGCDASIMLDGAEKSAVPNQSVRGYNVIDACKTRLEQLCPGIVSCTDIMVIATRVSVFLAGGQWYNVETGRRDSLTSNAQDAANLPGTTISVSDAVTKFAQRGLSAQDFVLLLGCHTVGIIHCNFFLDRLYNYQYTGLPDPSMNTTTLSTLRKTCPSGGSTNFAYADQTQFSGLKFDRGFYEAIKQGKGLTVVDQRMASDPITKNIVTNFATTGNFNSLFGGAINKLARYKILTGTNGQIRKNCNRVNY